MAHEFRAYVETLLRYVRWRKAHPMIRFDISGHLQDLYEGYCGKGLDHHQAVQNALYTIGPPESIGRQMNAVFRPRHSWDLLLLLIVPGVFGICLRGMALGNPASLLQALACELTFLLGYSLDAGVLKRRYRTVYGCYTACLGAAALLDWPHISHLFALYPLVFTGVLEATEQGGPAGRGKCVLLSLLPAALYAFSGSTGQLVPTVVICGALLCWSLWTNTDSPRGHLRAVAGTTAGTAALLAVMLAVIAAVKGTAVSGLVDPAGYWQRREDIRQAAAQLGLTGTGLTQPVEAYLENGEYLLLLGHRFGWPGALLVVLCVAVLLYYAFGRALRIHNNLGLMVALSVLARFLLELAVQVMGNAGLGFLSTAAHQAAVPISPTLLTFYLLGGVLLGAIRDGAVVYDWPEHE